MEIEANFDISLICRLCASNLLDFPECYSIDEEMERLVTSLTSIKFDHIDDKENLRICISCYDCLHNFNEFKHNAITTHEKLIKLDNLPIEEEEEEKLDIDQYEVEELMEEDLDEAEMIEYINTEEENDNLLIDDDNDHHQEVHKIEKSQQEVDFAVEKILDEIDDNDDNEFCGDDDDDEEDNKPIKKSLSIKKETYHDKGKETYQKLLQKCHICAKMIEKNRMEGHVNKHNNVRPFQCDECSKTFYCKQLLRLHRTSIHTNIKVKCEQCDKFFPSARALYAHTLRHKNQDRYICSMCEKKFNNSNSLKRHLAIHSGVREFVCVHCGVGFYRKFNLDVHIKNVHNQTKEYACSYDGCKKRFGYLRLLKDHVKKHHPNVKFDSVEF